MPVRQDQDFAIGGSETWLPKKAKVNGGEHPAAKITALVVRTKWPDEIQGDPGGRQNEKGAHDQMSGIDPVAEAERSHKPPEHNVETHDDRGDLWQQLHEIMHAAKLTPQGVPWKQIGHGSFHSPFLAA